jgi:hypothetical protein
MSERTPASDNDDQSKRQGGGDASNEPKNRELDDLPTDAEVGETKEVEPEEAPPAPSKTRKVRNPIESEEYFGVQYSKTSELPDPIESLKVLATGVVEVIAGTRQVEQLARWLTDDVYQRLQFRARRAEAQRIEQGIKAHYQNLSVGGLRTSSPRDGVIESVILLSSKSRTRAVTIRLEGINARWRATSVSVL